jgi:hypothetical protein
MKFEGKHALRTKRPKVLQIEIGTRPADFT